MTEQRCGSCRYWLADQVVHTITGRDVPVAGICGGIGSTWDWRLGDTWPVKGEQALLIDRNAELLTTSEFGCTGWELKP